MEKINKKTSTVSNILIASNPDSLKTTMIQKTIEVIETLDESNEELTEKLGIVVHDRVLPDKFTISLL